MSIFQKSLISVVFYPKICMSNRSWMSQVAPAHYHYTKAFSEVGISGPVTRLRQASLKWLWFWTCPKFGLSVMWASCLHYPRITHDHAPHHAHVGSQQVLMSVIGNYKNPCLVGNSKNPCLWLETARTHVWSRKLQQPMSVVGNSKNPCPW